MYWFKVLTLILYYNINKVWSEFTEMDFTVVSFMLAVNNHRGKLEIITTGNSNSKGKQKTIRVSEEFEVSG